MAGAASRVLVRRLFARCRPLNVSTSVRPRFHSRSADHSSSLISRCENVGAVLAAGERLALADMGRTDIVRAPPIGGGGGGSGRSLSTIVSVVLVLVPRSYDACGTI